MAGRHHGLDNLTRGSQNRDDMRRELGDVLGHTDKHAGGRGVVTLLDKLLDENVRVQEKKLALEGLGDTDFVRLQVLVRLEQNVVRDLVVSHLQLLLGDDDGSGSSLRKVPERHVQVEDVVRVLGHTIGLAHQEVDQRVGQNVIACLAGDLCRGRGGGGGGTKGS